MIQKLYIILNKIMDDELISSQDKIKHSYFIEDMIIYIASIIDSKALNYGDECSMLHSKIKGYSRKIYSENVLLFSKYIHTENLLRCMLFGQDKVFYKEKDTYLYSFDSGSNYQKSMHTVRILGERLEIEVPNGVGISASTYYMKEGLCTGKVLIPSGKYIVRIVDGYNSSQKGKIVGNQDLIGKLKRGLVVSFAVALLDNSEEENHKFIQNISDYKNILSSFQLEASIDDDWINKSIWGVSSVESYLDRDLKPWLLKQRVNKI
jgi:hypothetical protein